MTSSSPDKISQEYMNNENPFAYIRNYSENMFLDQAVKPKLDALMQIQPKFIPLGIDAGTIRTEQIVKTRMIVENHIKDLLDRGMQLVDAGDALDKEAVLRMNLDVPGVIDVLIDVNRLKLLFSQRKLREKVYLTLRNTLPPNMVNAIDHLAPVQESYLRDAIEYEKLMETTEEQ